jgi:hypothetical protein
MYDIDAVAQACKLNVALIQFSSESSKNKQAIKMHRLFYGSEQHERDKRCIVMLMSHVGKALTIFDVLIKRSSTINNLLTFSVSSDLPEIERIVKESSQHASIVKDATSNAAAAPRKDTNAKATLGKETNAKATLGKETNAKATLGKDTIVKASRGYGLTGKQGRPNPNLTA